MKINLERIELTNFKGTRQFATDFGPHTDIHGTNETGKTTLFDAFTWLLFDKDSSDRKTFELKTLDAKNKVIPKIEHSVSAILTVDGQRIELSKTLKEKWTKKRGMPEAEFTGNETSYLWNGVPMQAGDYQRKIGEMVNEDIFKLITNPLYFNQLKKEDRRAVLLQLAGPIEYDAIFNEMEQAGTAEIRQAIRDGKSIPEYRRQVAAERKSLNDRLQAIPTRIDEAKRTIPIEPDYELLQSQRNELDAMRARVEDQLLDKSQASRSHYDNLSLKQKDLYDLKAKKAHRENQIQVQIDQKRRTTINLIDIAAAEIVRVRQLSESPLSADFETKISGCKATLDELRQKWSDVDAETLTFSNESFVCPTCHQNLGVENAQKEMERLTNQFNESKSARLEKIQEDAAAYKRSITQWESQYAAEKQQRIEAADAAKRLQAELDVLTAERNAAAAKVADALESDDEVTELELKINALESEIENLSAASGPAQDALHEEKKRLSSSITELDLLLARKDTADAIRKRIDQLKNEERELAQSVADAERLEFAIEQFIKAQMDVVEQRVNGMFSYVRFRLFKTQINGGQEECCDALINGVPYADANNAAKINAGIDIINALCQYYDTTAPIFVDNAESVVQLTPTKSQIIRLVVDESAKTLSVRQPGAPLKQETLFANS